MPENIPDTGRIAREAEYHDRAAASVDHADALVDESFTAVTAVANQHILGQFGDLRGKRVLDYGCGAAEGGIYLAKLGAEVVAMDVSSKQLAAAGRLAEHHGVSIETRRVESVAIPAADAEFDLIYGNGVLHHVPLDTAVPELARILKPEGVGCFIEPLPYNPLINIYRRLATTNRTEDEQPLTWKDIDGLRDHFGEVSHREFWLATQAVFLKFYLVDRVHPNAERYWKKIYSDAANVKWFFEPLRRIDDLLLRGVPILRRLCWISVITVARPIVPAGRSVGSVLPVRGASGLPPAM